MKLPADGMDLSLEGKTLEIMDLAFQSFTEAVRSFFVREALIEKPVCWKKVAIPF